MLHRDWLYYLTDETGNCYTVSNGVVTKVPARTPLKRTPDGWQDVLIGWERNFNKGGSVQVFSLPLNFYEDGALIIRHLRYSGNRTNLYLLIQQFSIAIDDNYYYPEHRYFFKGQIDLSTFKDSESQVSVNVNSGAMEKLLKAKESTTNDISVPADPEAISVVMDGLALYNRGSFIVIDDAPDDPGDNTFYIENHIVGLALVNKEVGDVGGIKSVKRTKCGNNNPDIRATGEWFYIATAAASLSVKYKFTLSVTYTGPPAINPAAQLWCVIRTIKPDGNIRSQVVILQRNVSQGIPGVHNLQGNSTINVEEGDQLYLYTFMTVAGSSGDANTMFRYSGDDSILEVEYKYIHPGSIVKALKPFTTLKRLCGRVFGDESVAQSDLLNAVDDIALISGDGLRGFETAVLKTSLNTFYEAMRVLYAAGQGMVGNKFRIEPMEFFLNNQDPIHLGTVKDLKPTWATDLICNTVKVGYAAQSYENINGRYEFNNTHLYDTPEMETIKELNLVSPWRADPYGAELFRINTEGKSTTDNSADNEIFLLAVKRRKLSGIQIIAATPGGADFLTLTGAASYLKWFPSGQTFTITGSTINNGTFTVATAWVDAGNLIIAIQENLVDGELVGATVDLGVYQLDRPAYTSITGVPDPDTIFNTPLSPKRILMRHMKWIASMLFGFTGQNLTFKSTEKNADLWTVKDNPPESIKENSDIQIGSEGLFRPVYFELDTEVQRQIAEQLEANPNRCFSFEWDGQIYKGFYHKVGIAPDNDKSQVYRLLSTYDNDLTKLIR